MTDALHSSCIECNEVITQPMCPSCLEQRMQIMIGEHNERVAILLQPGKIEISEGITCLFCGELMNRCAHCVSKDVYLFLQEKEPGLAEEFMSRFDFDLRRTFV